MKKIFIVEYSTGDWDDYCVNTIFATTNEKTAIDYVMRFNRIVEKWKTYFKQFKDEDGYLINDDFPINYDRYCQIMDVNRAYYCEIETR